MGVGESRVGRLQHGAPVASSVRRHRDRPPGNAASARASACVLAHTYVCKSTLILTSVQLIELRENHLERLRHSRERMIAIDLERERLCVHETWTVPRFLHAYKLTWHAG